MRSFSQCMDQAKVGNLIKQIRQANDLTQKDLAELLGVTYQAVSKWENGKNIPDIETIKIICDEFNLDINDFLKGDKKKKNSSFKVILTLVTIFICFLLFIFINKDNYEFRNIQSLNPDLSIKGVVAFSKNNTSIFISDIILNNPDDSKYKIVECSLYETYGNQQVLISQCDSVSTNEVIMSDLLKDITFKVDNFSRSCNNFEKNSFILEINAIDHNNKIIKYEAPVKLEEKCQ